MRKALTICAVLCAMAAMTACKNGTSQPESDTLVQNEQSRGGSIIIVDATIFSEVAFLDGVLLIAFEVMRTFTANVYAENFAVCGEVGNGGF